VVDNSTWSNAGSAVKMRLVMLLVVMDFELSPAVDKFERDWSRSGNADAIGLQRSGRKCE